MLRRLFLLLLLTVPLLADEQQGVHVVPFGPVEGERIQVHIPMTCGVTSHNILREVSTIRITLLDPACVITLPIPYIYSLELPPLEAGKYRIEVQLQGSSSTVYGSTDLIVRNRYSEKFDLRPSAVPAFVGDLRVRLAGVIPPFADFWIEVNGVRATNVTREDGVIWFEPPPLPAGRYPVVVRTANTHLIGAPLYYYDDPDVAIFERILFPVLFSTSGANGSRWISEAVISNPKPWFVETANTISPVRPCLLYPCGERLYPESIERYEDGFPRGAVLHVPRNEAPQLAFALRVRDTSRQAEGFGTQVPVVRERDFVHGEVFSLLNVPLDPRYRVKVRMYALDPVLAITGQLTARNPTTNAAKFVRHFELQRVGEDQHWYAELDLPSGEASERVNLYLDFPLDSTAWAFATVTNNATQQVTIVTPNGSGEQPCTTCTVP